MRRVCVVVVCVLVVMSQVVQGAVIVDPAVYSGAASSWFTELGGYPVDNLFDNTGA